MDIRSDEISELILPESKEKKGYLVYLKIIFIPALLYVFILLGYYDIINFKVELHTVVMIGFIFSQPLCLQGIVLNTHTAFLNNKKMNLNKP